MFFMLLVNRFFRPLSPKAPLRKPEFKAFYNNLLLLYNDGTRYCVEKLLT